MYYDYCVCLYANEFTLLNLDPLTPLFPMEQTKTKTDVNTVDKKQAFPHENNFRSMTPPSVQMFRTVWRPNNYRRQLKVKNKKKHLKRSTPQEIKGTLPLFHVEINKQNHIITCKKDNIVLQYGSNFMTAIYSQKYIDGEKEVFYIESNSVQNNTNWIEDKVLEIEKQLDEYLFMFARKLNVVLPIEKPIWSRHEDWIIDKEIKQLEPWETLHADNIKKVYPKGIEFTGGKDKIPAKMLLNRIRNTGLQEYAPAIVSELNKLNLYMARREALLFLKNNVNSPNDVIKHKDYVNLLTDIEKNEFCEWMYMKLGDNG